MEKKLSLNTENKILTVATDLFAERGYDGTSVRNICSEAGVNISMISYYFGGKEELYNRVISRIFENIILHMRIKIGFGDIPENFDFLTQEQKIQMLLRCIELIIDYFYSGKISDAAITIVFREQMRAGMPLNAEGYRIFKKLLSSIVGKDENDKEMIFKTITIMGQVHSAKVFKQFALQMMGQSGYSKEDIQMLKQIVIENTKSILLGMGVKL